MANWNRKVVWPKDGFKGSRPRGFFGGLKDIVTGKGPDMFLQDGRTDHRAIRPDVWGNWDSYTMEVAQEIENWQHNGLLKTSRGHQRYDPQTRRYVRWQQDNDFHGQGTDGLGIDQVSGEGYPVFTARESKRMEDRMRRGLPSLPRDARKMGHDWDARGPKRFRPDHRAFWQDAHRIPQNEMLGLPFPWHHNPVREGPYALEMWAA